MHGLPFLNEYVRSEAVSLERVVGDIARSIQERRDLESLLLADLEERCAGLRGDLLRLEGRPSEWALMCRRELETAERQKVRTREEAISDILSLKKSLWHYWLLLEARKWIGY